MIRDAVHAPVAEVLVVAAHVAFDVRLALRIRARLDENFPGVVANGARLGIEIFKAEAGVDVALHDLDPARLHQAGQALDVLVDDAFLERADRARHADADVALSRALAEAAQARVTVISGARDDIGAAGYRPGIRIERQEAAARLLDETLNEEKNADQNLTGIAERMVNLQAADEEDRADLLGTEFAQPLVVELYRRVLAAGLAGCASALAAKPCLRPT